MNLEYDQQRPIRNMLYRGFNTSTVFDTRSVGFEPSNTRLGFMFEISEFRFGRTGLAPTDPIYLNP